MMSNALVEGLDHAGIAVPHAKHFPLGLSVEWRLAYMLGMRSFGRGSRVRVWVREGSSSNRAETTGPVTLLVNCIAQKYGSAIVERGAHFILEELCKGTMTCGGKRLRDHTPVAAVSEEVYIM